MSIRSKYGEVEDPRADESKRKKKWQVNLFCLPNGKETKADGKGSGALREIHEWKVLSEYQDPKKRGGTLSPEGEGRGRNQLW